MIEMKCAAASMERRDLLKSVVAGAFTLASPRVLFGQQTASVTSSLIANNLSLIANTQLGLVLVAIITLIGLLLSSSSGAGLVRVKS